MTYPPSVVKGKDPGTRGFRSILVPLDGSALAEQAIPTAVAIAARAGSKLKLLLVYEPPPPLDPGSTPTELELAMERADRDYLRSVAGRLRDRLGPALSSAVVKGPVTETLARYTRELGTDLIVMTTHGRGGIRRAWLGSVAERARRLPVTSFCRRQLTDPRHLNSASTFRPSLVVGVLANWASICEVHRSSGNKGAYITSRRGGAR